VTERAKRIAKIKALLMKRVENGCTEGEMQAALALARKLMDDYEIDDTDLAFGGEEVTAEAIVRTDHDKIRNTLATSVGHFCGCRTWSGHFDSITFCGLQSETLFAHWLLDMLADFVERAAQSYLDNTWRRGMPRVRRRERGSFIVGCVERIAERLRELTPKLISGNGRALVVAKNALIDNYMRERGIKLREPFKLHRSDPAAFNAGFKAGDDARFNRPVEGERSVRQLK
jgi:hypothetical protein